MFCVPYVFYQFIGVPSDYCNGKADGTFQLASDKSKYFSCVSGASTPCQTCPAGLVYVEVCVQCLEKDTSKFASLSLQTK